MDISIDRLSRIVWPHVGAAGCYHWLDWNFWALPIVGLRFPMQWPALPPRQFTTWGYHLPMGRAVLCVSYSWVSPLTLGCVYPWVFPIAQLPMVHSPASATTTTADLGAPSMGRAQLPGLMWSCFKPSCLIIFGMLAQVELKCCKLSNLIIFWRLAQETRV